MKRIFFSLIILGCTIFYSSYGMEGLQVLAAAGSFAEFEKTLHCESAARALSLKGNKSSLTAKTARQQMHGFITERQKYLETFLNKQHDIQVIDRVHATFLAFIQKQGMGYQKTQQYETDKKTLERLKQKSVSLAKPICPYPDLTQSTMSSLNIVQLTQVSIPSLLRQQQQLADQQRFIEEQLKKAQASNEDALNHLKQKKIQQQETALKSKVEAEELRKKADLLDKQAAALDKSRQDIDDIMNGFIDINLDGDKK